MNDTRYTRQLELLKDEKLDTPITIIGCGAVGSFTLLALSKMGCRRLAVYDDDIVSEHNLPNQFFRERDVGQLKVKAMQEIVQQFHGLEIEAHDRRWQNADSAKGIVISAVDGMDARQIIWRTVKNQFAVDLYIDSRMGAQVALLYSCRPLDPDDIRDYEQTLHPASEALRERCTARSIMYTVLCLSGHICRLVKRRLMNETVERRQVFDFS